MGDILLITFVFLVAGVIAVPIATRLGLGSVLGYLIAGIAISPLLRVFGVDVVSIQHFAEFGVVMMLFLVGLELEPRRLWAMRTQLIGLGGLQVGLTTLAIMGVGMMFGLPWPMALAVGWVLTMSSTAIVLQTLTEKGLMKSDAGRGSFSVLLFQDIAVIPMLALIPLLAISGFGAGGGGADTGGEAALSLTAGLPAWAQALVTLGAIGVVIFGGMWATRPMFRFIASANMREVFVAAALLWVIGIALLMTLVGLSPALGTFLAGVVLANSEYRHELESDIDPFKGLLLGLFFITVGAAIDFGLLFNDFALVLGLTLGLMVLKAAVLIGTSFFFGIKGADRWLFGLSLAHAGEFAFVLLNLTVVNHVLPQDLADTILLVVALSMLLTPGLFILYDKMIAPRYVMEEEEEADEIAEQGQVIIAGHGRFGGVINRMLRQCGLSTTVLDYSSAQLEVMRTFGLRAYFGDATRPDLLEAAGIKDASVIVVALDEKEQITALVHYVKKQHPHVHVVARAVDRPHVYELFATGADDIIRETFDSSVRAGRSVLEAVGIHPFQAERMGRAFVTRDKHQLSVLASLHDPDIPMRENTAYVEKAREFLAEEEAILKGKDRAFGTGTERGWVPPTVADVKAVTANHEREEDQNG